MRRSPHPIATPAMFLYLNSYAFLLIALGGGAIVISLMDFSLPVIVGASVAAFFCIRGAVKILLSWGDKKRKYDILIIRNRTAFRPDTFSEFMEAPCGRLLTKKVLLDLGIPEEYQTLKAIRKPLMNRIRERWAENNRKTVVHILNLPDKNDRL